MDTYPVRAGIFSSVDDAVTLVRRLGEAGFTWDEVSVICSDETKEKLFPEELRQLPSGAHTSQALTAAGAGLLGLAGVATIVATFGTAGTALVVIGALAGIAVGGAFPAVMATRGLESEATDYYSQAVQEGKILVAVEIPGETSQAQTRRNLAAELISRSGAEPLVLAH